MGNYNIISLMNPFLVLTVLFTLTLFFVIYILTRRRGNGEDEGFEFDRVCPVCHRLLKKTWDNCPYCGHKED